MTGHDVIVVGAGPAGSTAARILADSGHDVLLLERAHFPREHIGESLLAYGNALLTRLGMDAELARFGVVKRGAEFTSDDGTHRRVDFEAQGAGRVLTTWNVERSLFDRAMLRAAAAAGATVLEGARVTRVRTDHSGRIVGVDYRTDDRQHSAHAPMVIDASGRAGVISHQHLRARKVNSRHSRIAIWSHVEGVSEADNPGVTGDIQVGDHRDGWVWAIPLRPDKISVGAVTTPEVVREYGPARVFADHSRRIPRIQQRIEGGVSSELRAERDFSYLTERVAGPGFLGVGDAVCFLDPIFSGGVTIAMISGQRAADTAADVLAGRVPEHVAISEYSRFFKTGYDGYFRLGYAFYEAGYRLGRFLRTTGTRVEPYWLARLLSGDFWSGRNRLLAFLREQRRFDTFEPFELLADCPVYPELEAAGTHPARLGPPLTGTARPAAGVAV